MSWWASHEVKYFFNVLVDGWHVCLVPKFGVDIGVYFCSFGQNETRLCRPNHGTGGAQQCNLVMTHDCIFSEGWHSMAQRTWCALLGSFCTRHHRSDIQSRMRIVHALCIIIFVRVAFLRSPPGQTSICLMCSNDFSTQT